jgi:hypothetical protein
MWGNSHVPFLGGWGAAMLLRLPDRAKGATPIGADFRREFPPLPRDQIVGRASLALPFPEIAAFDGLD